MRAALAVVTLTLLLLTSSCHEDKDYAKELARIVRLYQEQVNRQVKGEQDYYSALASLLSRSDEQDVYQTLTLDRQERARQDASDLKQGKIGPFEVIDHLRNYAVEDFSQSRGVFEKEMDAQNKYLANLEKLAVESTKVQSLAAILDDFAKPQGLKDRVSDTAKFGSAVKSQFDKQTCDDLTDQIDTETKAKSSLKAEAAKAAADARIKLLTDRRASNPAFQGGKCVVPTN